MIYICLRGLIRQLTKQPTSSASSSDGELMQGSASVAEHITAAQRSLRTPARFIVPACAGKCRYISATLGHESDKSLIFAVRVSSERRHPRRSDAESRTPLVLDDLGTSA